MEASADAIERGDKEATEEEVAQAIEDFSVVFGEHAAFMAREQRAWRFALSRPRFHSADDHDPVRLRH